MRRQYYLYDGRWATCPDDAIVYSIASTFKEALMEKEKFFPDANIVSYENRKDGSPALLTERWEVTSDFINLRTNTIKEK